MHLLIDDKRDLNADVIARTDKAGKEMLFNNRWDSVMIDHDLGLRSEIDGYELIKWAIRKECLPKEIQLVTSNSHGRDNMAAALKAEGYKTKNKFNFYKL